MKFLLSIVALFLFLSAGSACDLKAKAQAAFAFANCKTSSKATVYIANPGQPPLIADVSVSAPKPQPQYVMTKRGQWVNKAFAVGAGGCSTGGCSTASGCPNGNCSTSAAPVWR